MTKNRSSRQSDRIDQQMSFNDCEWRLVTIVIFKRIMMKTNQTIDNFLFTSTFEFVENVRQTFADADTDHTGYLDINEFTVFMRKTSPELTDRDAQMIFMKIDTNCDGEVDLSEYLTYILFEHQERELMSNMSKTIPYRNSFEEFPSKSLSFDIFIGFQFFPALFRSGERLEQIDYSYGRYISISRHGLVSHWSSSFDLIRQTSIESSTKTLPFWISSMCVLPDLNYFAVATTDHQLIFYELNSHRYIGSIFLVEFPHRLTALDYRLSSNNRTAILCGDADGNLFIFDRPTFHLSESTRNFVVERILRGDYSTISGRVFCHIHLDIVQQIRWIDDLELIVSCSTTSKKSLFIGDFNVKMPKYAVSRKGFTSFDYSRTQRSIITAGDDGVIRFWDPFVTERASAHLRLHHSPIVRISVDNRDENVISIDQNKNLIISSIETMKILQRISLTFVDFSSENLTICYLNPFNQRLIIGNSRLIYFRHVNESFLDQQRTSHLTSITRTIYNSLFDVIISADESSTIHIWNLKTSEKSMQILNGHLAEYDEQGERTVEITAMICDQSQRRLITGAHDGSLALWNFNNGHNLYRIPSHRNEQKEITALLHDNERLFVAGWSRKVRVFHLAKTAVMRQIDEFQPLHHDDILSMDIRMNVLGTSSYDGEIILWTIETGLPLMKLNISQQFSSTMNFHLDQLIFLSKRETHPFTATLITGGNSGWIWCWSTHINGKLIAVFNGARLPQEHILSMCVDEKSQILFTSDTAGYVAIWFIGDFATKQPHTDEKQRMLNRFFSHRNSIRSKTFFDENFHEEKLRDRLGTPSIQVDLNEILTYPTLLVAFRAHLRPITSINFVSTRELVVTSSIDCTIRIFTLTGRYIGYFSEKLSFDRPWKDLPKKLPEDIRRKGSATTLEVLRGDIGKRWKLLKHTIVAWTSLPIFRTLTKNDQTSQIVRIEKSNRKERREFNGTSSTVESMLKMSRDQFGVTMPILGNFVRKFMKHQSRDEIDRIQIQNGKVMIYSLLPLENLPELESQSIMVEEKMKKTSSVRRPQRTHLICSSTT